MKQARPAPSAASGLSDASHMEQAAEQELRRCVAQADASLHALSPLFRKFQASAPSSARAVRALLFSLCVCAVGYTFLALAPWFLLPLAWLICGTAITGIVAVALDCANNTFTRSQWLNTAVGMLCLAPFCMPFESWKRHSAPGRNSLAATRMWWLSSLWDWVRANAEISMSSKMALNLTCVYLFVSLFFPLMAYNLGMWSIFKYYVIPWILYHFWASAFMKNGVAKQDELFACEYPAWVQWMSNNLSMAYSSVLRHVPAGVATYDAPAAVREIGRLAAELRVTVETRGLADAFDLRWAARVEWPTAVFLFATPLLGLYGVCTTPFHWQTYLTCFLSYYTGGLAITTAYHRCFSHRSYEMNRFWVVFWTLLGCQAFEGSVFEWCQDHRAHHRYTDTPKDPYNINQGFWHAHMGWLITKRDRWTQSQADISDLKADPFLRFQHRFYVPLAVLTGIVLPTVLCGLGWGDWRGGFYIAGVLAVVLTMQCTFFINSLAHWWGDATYTDERTPRDSALVSLLTWGEGYHNFHHEFPFDYRNGVHATAYDPSKWLIWIAEKVGWAWNVRRFDKTAIAKNKLTMQQRRLDEEKERFDWGTPIDRLPLIARNDLMRILRGDGDTDLSDEHDRIRTDAGKEIFVPQHGRSYMVIDRVVHDVTPFMDKHPGGRRYIEAYVGRDASRAFTGGVYAHSLAAKNILQTMRVARVVGDAVE